MCMAYNKKYIFGGKAVLFTDEFVFNAGLKNTS